MSDKYDIAMALGESAMEEFFANGFDYSPDDYDGFYDCLFED